MAWQVAILFDEGTGPEALHADLSILLGQMPVWAVAEYDRVPGAAELRAQWEKCWFPEPALTIMKPTAGVDPVSEVLGMIPIAMDHHFKMSAIRLFGINLCERLIEGMAELGFYPVSRTGWDGIGFSIPLDHIKEVREIRLDAASWQSEDDFYTAFFKAVGAPEWHGRNFNALYDSIGGGRINKVEVPYLLKLEKAQIANAHVDKLVRELSRLILNLQTNGCPVELRLE